MTESPLIDLGFAVLVFSPGDDPIAFLNKALAFLTVVYSSRVMLLVLGATMQVDRQGLLNATTIKTIILNNAVFETEDLDTYDSNCDDISNAKAVLMANISNYGSDVISEKAQRIQPTWYDGIVNKHVAMPMIDDEETLILEEDFGKRFVPQQELSAEEAFWYHMLNPFTKSSDALPVKIEAPKELLKVILVNESLKKLKLHLVNFDKVMKIKTTPNART
nr:hypothetical protein [Tanacetum cinerariifolium]